MAAAHEDDLETKLEDAFIELLMTELPDEIRNVYPWAEETKDDPCVIVKATRGDALTSTPDGDIVNVDVLITLRHAIGAVRRGIFRAIENGIGKIDDLAGRIRETAAGGGLVVGDDAAFIGSSKEFEENKIVREIGLRIPVAHNC